MALLFGRNQTREEILKRVGDISQICRAKPYRLIEGHEDGVLAVDVTTGSGLDFTAIPSRGMDISAASFQGRSLAWRSATSDQHPAFFEPEGLGWLRGFSGGLVTTCGLTWMGMPCTDNDQPLGLHGRASNIPATNVHWNGSWEGDEYVLSVASRIRESVVFGENVQLTRRIWTRLGESRLFIEDSVENMGFQRIPHMLLYHINIGFPVVDSNTRLISPTLSATPRDKVAARDADRFAQMQPPKPGFSEQVYFHEMRANSEGKVTAALVNPDLDGGFGVYVTYNQSELPYFTQWKMMGEGTYVCGLEPANALVLGRDTERREGRLQYLDPGERREYTLEVGVISGAEQVNALESAAKALNGGQD